MSSSTSSTTPGNADPPESETIRDTPAHTIASLADWTDRELTIASLADWTDRELQRGANSKAARRGSSERYIDKEVLAKIIVDNKDRCDLAKKSKTYITKGMSRSELVDALRILQAPASLKNINGNDTASAAQNDNPQGNATSSNNNSNLSLVTVSKSQNQPGASNNDSDADAPKNLQGNETHNLNQPTSAKSVQLGLANLAPEIQAKNDTTQNTPRSVASTNNYNITALNKNHESSSALRPSSSRNEIQTSSRLNIDNKKDWVVVVPDCPLENCCRILSEDPALHVQLFRGRICWFDKEVLGFGEVELLAGEETKFPFAPPPKNARFQFSETSLVSGAAAKGGEVEFSFEKEWWGGGSRVCKLTKIPDCVGSLSSSNSDRKTEIQTRLPTTSGSGPAGNTSCFKIKRNSNENPPCDTDSISDTDVNADSRKKRRKTQDKNSGVGGSTVNLKAWEYTSQDGGWTKKDQIRINLDPGDVDFTGEIKYCNRFPDGSAFAGSIVLSNYDKEKLKFPEEWGEGPPPKDGLIFFYGPNAVGKGRYIAAGTHVKFSFRRNPGAEHKGFAAVNFRDPQTDLQAGDIVDTAQYPRESDRSQSRYWGSEQNNNSDDNRTKTRTHLDDTRHLGGSFGGHSSSRHRGGSFGGYSSSRSVCGRGSVARGGYGGRSVARGERDGRSVARGERSVARGGYDGRSASRSGR